MSINTSGVNMHKNIHGHTVTYVHMYIYNVHTTLIADAATGVEDFYSQEQTVIQPYFYPRLCHF